VRVPEAILASIVRVAATSPEITAVYVFGSQAAGSARADSDVDLGVLYANRQPLETTLALEEAFGRATGRRVDLIDAAQAAPFLALEIVRGERVFCRTREAADRFELYVLRRAGDLLPFERERQALAGLPRT
jgi:predicted nucleotidyltransferase